MSSAELVPSPQITRTASADRVQDMKIDTRAGMRSDIHPVSAFPGTEAARVSFVSGCTHRS